MISLSKFVSQHMLVVFFVYGLGFFVFGIAIILKEDKRSAVRVRRLLLLLAGFGLLHGASEWSDMFLTLGETYWTVFLFHVIKIAGFYFGLSSFVLLLAFGVRSIAVEKRFKWLKRASLIASLLLAAVLTLFGIRSGLNNQWFVTSGVLMRYLLAFPASLLAALGLFRQSQSSEIKEIHSSNLSRNIRAMAVVFAVYAVLVGVVVPKASFPPATFINYDSFENVFVFPVQLFRAACSLLATWSIMAVLNAFSAASYGELEKQVQERTSDLVKVNEKLLTDIAARKRVEAELERSRDAAVESSRVKSEFVANMSHEIRTPLHGVIGMTDLALDTKLEPEQREYLETVKMSADSLLTVINDILDFSKMEAGKIDLEAADFNLRDFLETAMKTLALRAHEKGLELLCEIAPEVPDVVRGDSSRLRQVIMNLIGNAIKFTSQGEVALRVKTEEHYYGEVCLLHLTVADTGIGIPPEKIAAIFDPFTQADTSTTRKYGGTGLGLTISKRLVEMMDGKIWVESEVGRGSEFHFIVRMGSSSAKTIVVGAIAPPEILRGVKVLVVDDNQTNRRILDSMLKRWEMKPTLVEGGEEALAQLNAARDAGESYGLILTDMHMPKMDGFSLVERIREKPDLSTATIMMLTSAGHRGDASRCQDLGVMAYLLKPIRQSELREAIARVLGAKEQTGAIPLITRYSLHDAREPSASLRVLLTEDNFVNQRLATRLLEKRGHYVAVAGNGREALAALEKESFDLVLMDLQMPEMDGFEATTAIRKSEKNSGSHLSIVALTAHAMKGDREKCLAAGMDGYLTKPIRPQELDEILEKYVSRRIEPVKPI